MTIPAHLRRKTAPTSQHQATSNRSSLHAAIKTKLLHWHTLLPAGFLHHEAHPRIAHKLASLPGYLNRHPYTRESDSQGFLACLYDLQNILCDVTGMPSISLSPMARHKENLPVSRWFVHHRARNDHERNEILIPNAAHGTLPQP